MNNEKIKALELLIRIQGVNNWIEGNPQIGNANMYEITDLALQRNDLTVLGLSDESLDKEVEKMVKLRDVSISDFLTEVPECKPIYEAVINNSPETQMLNQKQHLAVCKALSVPFFIYNTRKYGMGGDILRVDNPQPNFVHDNLNEVKDEMVSAYAEMSDELKKLVYPAFDWTLQNSLPAIKTLIEAYFSIEPVEEISHQSSK